MFGKDNDGYANSKAKAGLLPTPEASKLWIVGTSAKVAKYKNTPVKLTKKLDINELPPTSNPIFRDVYLQ